MITAVICDHVVITKYFYWGYCGDESQSTALRLLVNFVSMPNITQLMRHQNGQLSSQRFPNLCYFWFLCFFEHRVSTALRNQDSMNLEATEIMSCSFYFIPVGDWYKQCGCVEA